MYNPIPLVVDMSRFRTSLVSSLAVFVCVISFGALDSVAAPIVSAKLISLTHARGEVVHLTLRTQEGLERFIFTPRESGTTTSDETHFTGFARPRNFQKDTLPAALTVTDRRAWVFFTSRRTGRPAAAIITLTKTDAAPLTRYVRVSRVPAKTLECGSVAAGHTDHSTATSSKRRVNRAGNPTIHAQSSNLFTPARVLEVATEADYEFSQIYGADTNTYIRAVLNAVDAIYSSNLGVRVKVVGQRVTTTSRGGRGSIDALSLLEEFRDGAFASSSRADVRHLFTGRSIEGLTIGIAYVASTCTHGGHYGVGLSRAVSAGLQPFLAAHEIAHNLSANHDGEAHSIMNPAITEQNNRFSARALTSIYNFVATSAPCMGSEALSAATTTLNSTDPTLFDARVAFLSTASASCVVTLYGSSDGRRYATISTRRIPRSATTSPREVAFTADAPPLSSPQSFFFKAKVSCGSARTISPPAKLRYGLASSGSSTDPRSASRWLETLRRNLK